MQVQQPARHNTAPSRRADIQGLRAVAVLMVVAYHAGLPVPGGFTGVDVFFVISGYVITELVLRQLQSPNGFSLGGFYGRRMRRLLPALALMIAVTLIIAVVLQSPFGAQDQTAKTAVGASLFVANFTIYTTTGGYFDGPAEFNPLLHTWSLSVEEQFYFIFPSLLLLSWLWGRKRWGSQTAATLVVALLTIITFSLSVLMSFNMWGPWFVTDPAQWAFYSSITRAWEFAVGALLALTRHRWQHMINRSAAILLATIGLLLLAYSAWGIESTDAFPGYVALAPVLGTAALIAAGTTPHRSVITHGLSISPLVWIGALSYSWYLWHWPVIVYARILWPDSPTVLVLAAGASLLPAWLAYRFVEDPIRRNDAITGRRLATLVFFCIAGPVVLALGLWFGSRRFWGSTAIQQMASQIVPLPISYYQGCDSAPSLPAVAPQDMDNPEQRRSSTCVWNADGRGAPVYLIGDSQAGQLAEGVIGAGEILSRPVVIADLNSCPLLARPDTPNDLVAEDCRTYVDDTLAYLQTATPGDVLIAISPNYVNPESARDFQAALTSSLSLLADTPHRVALIDPVPQFPGWTPWACTLWDTLIDAQGCGTERSLDSEIEVTQDARQVFTDAADATATATIDLLPQLCQQDQCSTNRDNEWVYRDSFHITTGESSRLTPTLAAYLSASQ